MNKLSWIELRKAIAAQAGATEKETAAFLNALIEQIQNGLKTDRQVRITGLGIFRLQEVAPRKSVDVTTGEAIVIPGYNKVNFAPEIGVKELIQSGTPIAPTEEDSPLQRLGKQADEIVAIINSDINVVTEPETPETPEKPGKPDIPETPEIPEKPECLEKQQSALLFLRDLIITLVVLILILVGCYFFFKGGIRGWIDKQMNQADSTITTYTKPVVEPIAEPVVEPVAEPVIEPVIPSPRVYTQFMATETILRGSRLAYLARKYYGQTDLWVFIYEANRDQYPNPNDIPMGNTIRIPVLPDTWQDLSNPQVKAVVDELVREYTR